MPDHAMPTCFAGRLARAVDGWRWVDGEHEPAVIEVPSADAGFRLRVGGAGDAIEIPSRIARACDALRWVLLAGSRGDYDIDVSSGAFAIPTRVDPRRARATAAVEGTMVVLVPIRTWWTWTASFPLLPAWDPDADWSLHERAIRFGWSDDDAAT